MSLTGYRLLKIDIRISLYNYQLLTTRKGDALVAAHCPNLL
jgi:hypothetical protein